MDPNLNKDKQTAKAYILSPTTISLEGDALHDTLTDDYIQELFLSLDRDANSRSATSNQIQGGATAKAAINSASLILEAIQSAARNIVDPKTGQVTKATIDQSWKTFKNDIRGGLRSLVDHFQSDFLAGFYHISHRRDSGGIIFG